MTTFDHEAPTEQPRYIPARMINEFVFCPRFFHLAWVNGETGENELTVDGKWVHRQVDEPRGRTSVDGREPRRLTSLEVSSDRLGVIAKADVIHIDDGSVVPVEVKRGRPRRDGDPVAAPERIQLITIGLVLRDNGYVVERGEVAFAEARDPVVIEIDEAAAAEAEAAIAAARVASQRPVPPPPLVDSPKCPTCIMASACLPDEVNFALARSAAPPRRLVPSDDAARPVYATEPGTRLGVDGERLSIKQGREEIASLRLIDVSQVNVFGNVQVSTQLLRELFARETPVCWFSGGGWFLGMADGLPGRNVELRRRQVLIDDAKRVEISREMVVGKILNARTLLRRNTRLRNEDALREMKRLARLASHAGAAPRLLGLEGGAARVYFSQFGSMLREDLAEEFRWEKRTRRPPADAVNCVLSYVYSLLVKDCVAMLFGLGFDPYIGVYHQPRFGRPALALDVAEEFRPIVADSTVLTVFNNGEVRPSSFIRRGGGVGLTSEGRRSVISCYERRMDVELTHPVFGYRITYRRALEVQGRVLAATLIGDLDRYRALTTR